MKKIIFLMVATLALAGCPGNKDRNNISGLYPNGIYGQYGIAGNLQSCGFNAVSFGQPVTASLPQGQLTLMIAGDPGQMGAAAWQGMNPIFAYQGPSCITGTLHLNSSIPLGMCMLPPGQYQITSQQAGTYRAGVFMAPQLLISGQVQALVGLTDGVILTGGSSGLAGFSALLVGIQGPSPVAMGYTNCADLVGVRF